MATDQSFFPPEVTLTPAIYYASKPPAVRELYKLISGEDRDKLALKLAQAGYTLDVPIDVWNQDPRVVMYMRKIYGNTWAPSALMQPANGQPCVGPVPPGAIKVSVDARDYPPFDPPPPPPIVDTHIVGALMFSNIYTYGPGAVKDGKYVVTDGQIVEQDGVHYRTHINAFAVGFQVYFEKVG